MDMRDALLKAGLVSQNDISKSETQKEEDKRLQEKREAQKQEQHRIDTNAKERLATYALFGHLSRQMVAVTHRTVKELLCSVCGAEGSTRVDVMAVHAQMLKERSNFLFLIDLEEGQKFAQELKDRIGIIIDPIEGMFEGEMRKFYVCVPCQRELLKK